MKHIILLSTVLFIYISVAIAQDKASQIEFDQTTYNYDTIAQNSNGECTFTFTNTGNAPLIITKTSASCGCTTPLYDPRPVMPGKKGQIKVKYNTSFVGNFRKTIVVKSNASNMSSAILTIKGFVKKGKKRKS